MPRHLRHPQSRRSPDSWKLVWSDATFDGDGRPDPAKWTYETGFVRNQELQWYQPENAWCENGLTDYPRTTKRKKNPDFLTASSKLENQPRICRVHFGQSHDERDRQVAIRTVRNAPARIDTRAGLWPAFWTVGAEGRWPSNGEIDIMEYYRDTLLANLIWAGEGRTASFTKRKPLVFHRSRLVQSVPRLAHGLG